MRFAAAWRGHFKSVVATWCNYAPPLCDYAYWWGLKGNPILWLP